MAIERPPSCMWVKSALGFSLFFFSSLSLLCLSFPSLASCLGRLEQIGNPPPSSTGDPSTEASMDPIIAAAPPPFTLDDLSICRMLKTVMTIQVAHGQLLVDVLAELQSLRADLASLR